ncbi:putative triacylglycerol lipase-like protein [Rosellinia necatrix]|uniref:Putative triacylglycerol lipase-like protein n=1 Tax=Rosellinia necatrix TaxID=77044 RepID=A0A1S8A4V9_ROSNE|nr:putative triacylglycerol lipase-like protein [Rosellinia necatrix]
MSIPMTPEAQAKAEAALHAFVVEDWTLFSICLTLTIFRTYGRTRNAGWGGLQGDDYFIFVALVFYAAETTLAYLVGAVAMGLANNGMTKEQRETIDPNGEEYRLR